VRTWAFPINDRKAKHEGFDANTVTGSMDSDDEYPGCPHCGSMGFVQCGCGKIGCNDGSDYYTCPWCGDSGELESADSFDVSGGGY
jgi:transcription elongation factor Elf1